MPGFRVILLVALVAMVGCFQATPEPAVEVTSDQLQTPVEPLEFPPAPPAPPLPLPVAPMPHEPGERDLTNEDVGLDLTAPDIVDRIAEASLPEPAPQKDPGQVEEPPAKKPIVLPGFDPADDKLPVGSFSGRSDSTRPLFIKHYGGSDSTEKAVAQGLEWLAKQQKKDGSWAFDAGTFKNETAAATGFALLAFLGAGETHKLPTEKEKKEKEERKYQKTVKAGVDWLVKSCPVNGAAAGRLSTQMYTQGIAALALVEAYGMTKDAALKPVVQAAVNYILRAQGVNGSWGYSFGTNGDTSISGWQVQALFAAKQAGLAVDDKVLKNAIKFLNASAAGNNQDKYGYADAAGAAPGTALTASGLWTRICIDGWTPDNPGLKDGAAGILKNPPAKNRLNLYYLHYATMVVRSVGGEAWQTWNEGPKAADGTRKDGLRDILIAAQITQPGANQGSWDPDAAFIGQSCGRLGTTALCVINLEAYYRYGTPDKKDDKKGPGPKK